MGKMACVKKVRFRYLNRAETNSSGPQKERVVDFRGAKSDLFQPTVIVNPLLLCAATPAISAALCSQRTEGGIEQAG
jgi:hypothetical protein